MKQFIRITFWVACVAVTVLSLLPSDQLPPGFFDWWDKAQHALAFFALCSIGLRAYPANAVHVALGLLVYGCCIELAQGFSGWRFGDWLDWLADAIGIAAAYLGWIFLKPARSQGQISAP